jgi:hypothetical protein
VAERIWSVYLAGETHSARTAEQVVDVLRYVVMGKLP